MMPEESDNSDKSFRIATFNVENLFARYRFKRNEHVNLENSFHINQLAFDIYKETEKRLTAKAIKEVDADMICLQEIENLPVLDRFNSRYLMQRDKTKRYIHRILIDGNDRRQIDVAVLTRKNFPIIAVRSYRHLQRPHSPVKIFSRDCLEVDVKINGRILTLYINHFKSMVGGRDNTRDRRIEQVKKVAEIVLDRWKSNLDDANFVILGDFNDYVGTKTSLKGLLNNTKLKLDNLVERLPPNDRWTHYWAGGDEYSQLDYILLPVAFNGRAGSPMPEIMRKGMAWRVERYDGERFEDVGENHPKASDHAPVIVDIPYNALK